MLSFDQPDFNEVTDREWIVTNGIGGYASSSLCGANTRRYHGLLVASFNPPTDRRVLVSKLEEIIKYEGQEFSISSNAYPGVIHPQGFHLLTSFERKPFPVSVFQKEKITIAKTVFMRHGSNTTVVEYQNLSEVKFQLQLIPLFTHRDYHHPGIDPKEFQFQIKQQNKTIEIIARPDLPSIWMHFSKGKFAVDPDWYWNFQYEREKERGLDYQEDLKSIGTLTVNLAPGDSIYITFSTELKSILGSPRTWKAAEAKRIENVETEVKSEFLRDLIISGKQFIVDRASSESSTLIAGYHWFTDWGRDTMIAMRGLVIETRKKKLAESIFETFLSYLDAGMIPNRFPDQGEEPEYNNVDGTLWMFVALHDYLEKFNDTGFIKKIYPKLGEIISYHQKGTRFNIHVTKEGLLFGGEEGTQLTWMDAKVHGHVVTPRMGCPVEINVLWYNALCIYADFGKRIGLEDKSIRRQIKKTRQAFREHFLHKKGYLYDVVISGKKKNDQIRPNQIYAISLPYPLLDRKEGARMLKIVTRHLYTPFGLRSLSPKDPDFKAEFIGDPWSRDHAYHQGTVWSHLWGEYALAYLWVHQYSPAARKYILLQAGTLEEHFYHQDGIHCISEVFDGGIPNRGKGCIQQAWSIGNTIKALLMAEN